VIFDGHFESEVMQLAGPKLPKVPTHGRHTFVRSLGPRSLRRCRWWPGEGRAPGIGSLVHGHRK
jgi:hypothetical protein